MQRPRPRLPAMLLAVVLAIATAGLTSAESASIVASVQVMPLEITLELSTLEASVGETVRAKATITDAGPVRVANVTVELRLDQTALKVKGSLTASISKLQPGRSTSITWNLCATRAGNDLVLARATVGSVSVESPTRLLVVSGQPKRGCS